MRQTVRAVYDGQVLRPDEPVALQPGATCTLTVDSDQVEESALTEYVLTSLAHLAADLGVSDLAEHHTDYAHGRKARR